MQRTIRNFALYGCTVLVLLLLSVTGCSVLTKPVLTRQALTVPGMTNYVLVTNLAPASLSINAGVGGVVVVTNYPAPVIVTNMVIVPPRVDVVTVTNWIPNSAYTDALGTAQAVNSALNPTPTAPLVNWGLSLAAGLATVAAAWQNSRAKGVQTLLETVVAGVETAPDSVGVKEQIARVATLKGSYNALNAVVQGISSQIKQTGS